MKILQGSLLGFICVIMCSCQKTITTSATPGTVKITLKNTVKGNAIVLNTGTYLNGFGEQYSISKFKYYISNISLGGVPINGLYFLVDESNPASLSFTFNAPANSYSSISFLIGVDSTRNVSGAQTGALDPLNDMFWTWNSGYIMAKMEGNSPQSTVVNNKVEYHIGGFSGVNSVLTNQQFMFSPAFSHLNVREGKTSEILIEADIDKWWQGSFNLKIAEKPVAIHPGALAKSISANYSNMFKIVDVKNY